MDYIPREDANFLLWAQAFSGGISANSAAFMLTPAQAASIAGTVAGFAAALATATFEGTRTSGTVAAKDDARSICETMCRQYAIDIKNNEGITDQNKIDIGVRPINPNREPVNVPTTQPLLNITGQLPGQMTLRYADSTTSETSAKPIGAANVQVFLGVSDEEPANIADCQFLGAFTRNPIEVDFDESQDKKTATFYARWASAKGEVGPWSLPMTMTIAA